MKSIYVLWGFDEFIVSPQALAFCDTEKVALNLKEIYKSNWDKMIITKEKVEGEEDF